MSAPAGLIKSERWWNDKAPPVLGLAYFLLAVSETLVPLARTLVAMVAFMVSFIGVAGYGHVVNDLCDVAHDRAAGKRNTMQDKSRTQRTLIVCVLLGAAWLPWLLLPANRWNLSLVGVQLLLLTVYAMPPLRLKVRAIPGVVTDALYAYTVPALITWAVWGRLGGEMVERPFLLATIIPWTLFAGVRGILDHQCRDAEADVSSGVETFATRYGRHATMRVLTQLVLPAELLCFAAMTIAFSRDVGFYAIAVVVFIGWRTFQLTFLWDATLGLPWRVSAERFVELYGYQFLGEFYTNWFPLFMLAALSLRSWPYLALAVIHVALFQTGLGNFFRYDLRYIPAGISKMRRRLA